MDGRAAAGGLDCTVGPRVLWGQPEATVRCQVFWGARAVSRRGKGQAAVSECAVWANGRGRLSSFGLQPLQHEVGRVEEALDAVGEASRSVAIVGLVDGFPARFVNASARRSDR